MKTKIPENYKGPIKLYVDETIEHFQNKEHGWPLDISVLVDNIFYEVNGFHLSDVLGDEIQKQARKKKLKLSWKASPGVEIRLTKDVKKAKVPTKTTDKKKVTTKKGNKK